MAASRVGRSCLCRRHHLDAFPLPDRLLLRSMPSIVLLPQPYVTSRRTLRTVRPLRREDHQNREEPFKKRLGTAWNKTEIKWRPIPIGLGIAFLGFWQLWRIRSRESIKEGGSDGEAAYRAPRRERIRPAGGWQVRIMSTLPLKALSRLWGQFNELTIPYYLRAPGFKLYGWIFGVNFDEVPADLHTYPNLAAFFYRELKPGVRPLDPDPQAIGSPADGRVLQFGTIQNGEVEQVKGMTYSLDALLGSAAPATSPNPSSPSNIFSTEKANPQSSPNGDPEAKTLSVDQEFANINNISYTLPNLLSGKSNSNDPSTSPPTQDGSTTPKPSSIAAVRASMPPSQSHWWSPATPTPTTLFYCVVYLAPGDYHRFHSPTTWLVHTRRHFSGELYSVSPYLQRSLPGLFTLNERVVLLGRYKHGFFSYTAVGATNVGSIKINFDKELKTNSLVVDTEADRLAEEARQQGEKYSGYSEVGYVEANGGVGGYALKKGEEMGGFQLGSSIVMVFQAPAAQAGDAGGPKGFKWCVEKGQKIKMGEALGYVQE